MNVESLGLILCALVAICVVLATVAAGLFLATRKSGNAPVPSELAYFREEVARLHKEVEQLREAVEEMKNGPTASGSTDFKR